MTRRTRRSAVSGGRAPGAHGPSWLAGPPSAGVVVPDVVRGLARGDAVVPVWENEAGGLTFRLGDGPGARFAKWQPASSGVAGPGREAAADAGGAGREAAARGDVPDLRAEAARLRWAAPFTPVPEVLDAGTSSDGDAWLVTRALAGESAVSPRWLADPRTAVRALGEGLRALHDALPAVPAASAAPAARPAVPAERHVRGVIRREWPDERAARREDGRTARREDERAARREDEGAGCPFDWGVAERVRHAAADGVVVDPALVARAPEPDLLVVCHGDACAPNTLLADDGRWLAHVDLGRLGVADRWADLAVATWSTQWNYGPGWEGELLAAYGVEPDPERTAFYRELWEAT